ncbi:nickel/cobalt transporter (plasmid) [Shinella sp. PSBB067]|uniref:nickel/cobalt transporter n=1 Tax=Shinella sp. PSBB067 TaxID=2715959 RepID=UPI00193B53E4|nr:nickel/cobalt transporter [Shinella sp. PSBB067]QRI66198.1 nickel/cobalt transporter [Shinella sp. PSBB067]
MRHLRGLAVLAATIAMSSVALAASGPFGIATPDSPVGNGVSGPAAPLYLAAIRLQTLFYQKLTSALDAFSGDPHAGLWLVTLSFLYGIFHAIGPGHGKAVISSFVLATGERLRQAAVMSVLASALQAFSAIAIVLVAATVFDATASQITVLTDRLELGSYALITLLGVTLLAAKARVFMRHWGGRRPAGSFACEPVMPDGANPAGVRWPGLHRHDATCGCLAASHLAMDGPATSRREKLQAIVSVGLRPCSGALIVLVFALARHLALAGMISVLAMAAGTALTVSFVAALSVMARGLLARFVLSGAGGKHRFAASLEFAGACAVFLFGVTMLTGLLVADGVM